ncbi:hypothetical protein BD324DRAFT_192292 [Kockovaella imperatae]|uniref:Uncharacterized protein n=1 Tax=Kockovaella imperatae TaxID=4999 RepID=A0A1Y1U902_9TREE|nr:hypothetical protein BD324DRAFT_192292 [Kockovaella imperatae]ORX34014.1 hypothetical protein BD324DRAFT_192292 [Kockovaella imperatae]
MDQPVRGKRCSTRKDCRLDTGSHILIVEIRRKMTDVFSRTLDIYSSDNPISSTYTHRTLDMSDSSAKRSQINIPRLPPVITITPATLPSPQNLPPTPDSLQSPKHDEKKSSSPSLPATAKSASPSPIRGILPILTDRYDEPSSLLIPLTRHLQLLHPQTPTPVIEFVATRLISHDRPYGHSGPWKPLGGDGEDIDLSAAGIGREACKGFEQRENGRGRELDRKLEGMYRIARESWNRLDDMAPCGGR